MPKVIKDVKTRIVASATEQFNRTDFHSVDIRQIAKDCSIAVGTVYNYYPNKKSIMYAVFEALWSESIRKLDELIDSGEASSDLFRLYTEMLHFEMMKKKGIGRDLMRLELMDNPDETKTKKNFFEDLDVIKRQQDQIHRMLKKSFGMKDQSVSVKNMDRLSNTTLFLLMSGNTQDCHYVEFVQDLVSSYINSFKQNG